jgi:hypothetical protein
LPLWSLVEGLLQVWVGAGSQLWVLGQPVPWPGGGSVNATFPAGGAATGGPMGGGGMWPTGVTAVQVRGLAVGGAAATVDCAASPQAPGIGGSAAGSVAVVCSVSAS